MLSPAAFSAQLRAQVAAGDTRFTARSDLEQEVLPNYCTGFLAAFRSVRQLLYFNVGWRDTEVAALAEALAYMAEQDSAPLGISRIWLAGNEIGDDDSARAIGRVVAAGVLDGGTEIDLEGNELTSEGKAELCQVCVLMGISCRV